MQKIRFQRRSYPLYNAIQGLLTGFFMIQYSTLCYIFRVLGRVFYCHKKTQNNYFPTIPNKKGYINTLFLPIFMPFLAMFCVVWYNLLGNSKKWLRMAYFDIFEQMFY